MGFGSGPGRRCSLAVVRGLLRGAGGHYSGLGACDRCLVLGGEEFFGGQRHEAGGGDDARRAARTVRQRVAAVLRAGLVDGERAAAQFDLLNLGGCLRINLAVVNPAHFEVGGAEVLGDNHVDLAFNPAKDRSETLLQCRVVCGFGRGAVHHGDERLRAYRECVADDPRQPLVVLVFQRRLDNLLKRTAFAGEKSGLALLGLIAGHLRVPDLLEHRDLVRGERRVHPEDARVQVAVFVVR